MNKYHKHQSKGLNSKHSGKAIAKLRCSMTSKLLDEQSATRQVVDEDGKILHLGDSTTTGKTRIVYNHEKWLSSVELR